MTVADGQGGSATDSFVLTVNPVNDPPTISNVTNKTIAEDSSLDVSFDISDIDTALFNLTLTVGTTNGVLFGPG